MPTAVKDELHRALREARAHVLSRLDGLGEHELRRPMTATGTNLLGLVKHLIGSEYGYLGAAFGRPAPEPIPWVDDGSIWAGSDMWARPEERAEDIVAMYHRATDHADRTIAGLELDAVGAVAHWPVERRQTTLAVLLVRMLGETTHHAGHADIVRELIDGRGGADQTDIDPATWHEFVEQVRASADAFPPGGPPAI